MNINAKFYMRELVVKWTQQAQNCGNTDAERNTYYECAKELHELIARLNNENEHEL